MRRYRFRKIDAFVSGSSAGNPAGYIFSDGPAPDAEMQQIARELKGFVSEVGVVTPGTGTEEFIIRYFSCEREVDFCGHATVAILDDLIKNTPSLQEMEVIRIRTKSGVVEVENRVAREGRVNIHAPPPQFIDQVPPLNETAAALGLEGSDLNDEIPPGVVHVGQNILIIRLRTLRACLRCSPDYERLRTFARSHGIEVIHISSDEAVIPGHAFRTRVFAPAFGYLEDPATGSGNAAFGYHLFRNGLWDGRPLIIEQGPDEEHPNIVHISRSPDGRVVFGGNGVLRIDGWYCLQ